MKLVSFSSCSDEIRSMSKNLAIARVFTDRLAVCPIRTMRGSRTFFRGRGVGGGGGGGQAQWPENSFDNVFFT